MAKITKTILILLFFTQLLYAQSRYFDGDDYILIPDDTSFDLGAGASLTVMALIKPTDITYVSIVDKYYDGSTRQWMFIISANKKLTFYVASADGSAGVTYEADTDLTPYIGIWIHISAVFDNDANLVYVYLNSVSDMTPVAKADDCNTNNQTVNIGILGHTSANEFTGQIDEVRCYNKALSVEEITTSMSKGFSGQQDGLIAYWAMDEESGHIFDKSGFGNHSTSIVGTTTRDNAPIKRIVGE